MMREQVWIRSTRMSKDCESLRITTSRDTVIVATLGRNGLRWTDEAGKRLRDSVVRDALPDGYADAVADILFQAYRSIAGCAVHIRSEIEQDLAQRRAEIECMWKAAKEYRAQLEDELFRRYAPGRHATLSQWRHHNPSPADCVPACLSPIRHVKRLEMEQPCHVYFLLKGGVVVYVGQTASKWPSRIEQHVKEGDKDFDDVWYLEVDRQSLNSVEAQYIQRYRPKYNLQIMRLEA